MQDEFSLLILNLFPRKGDETWDYGRELVEAILCRLFIKWYKENPLEAFDIEKEFQENKLGDSTKHYNKLANIVIKQEFNHQTYTSMTDDQLDEIVNWWKEGDSYHYYYVRDLIADVRLRLIFDYSKFQQLKIIYGCKHD